MTGLAVICVIFAVLLGGCFGSFMNVVVWRLPNGMSLVHPGSFCPKCGHAIRFYDNLPVLSWFILRGKCRDCHDPISLRYPLIELICAATAGLFASMIFFGLWNDTLSGVFQWNGLGEWVASIHSAAAGPSYFVSVTPETVAAAGLGMTFLWTGFFYLLLTVGLIEWDGNPVPNSLLNLLLVVYLAAIISPFFRGDLNDPFLIASPVVYSLGIVVGLGFLPLFFKQSKEWLFLCLLIGPVMGGGMVAAVLMTGILSIVLYVTTQKRAPGLIFFAVCLGIVLLVFFGFWT